MDSVCLICLLPWKMSRCQRNTRMRIWSISLCDDTVSNVAKLFLVVSLYDNRNTSFRIYSLISIILLFRIRTQHITVYPEQRHSSIRRTHWGPVTGASAMYHPQKSNGAYRFHLILKGVTVGAWDCIFTHKWRKIGHFFNFCAIQHCRSLKSPPQSIHPSILKRNTNDYVSLIMFQIQFLPYWLEW